MHRIVKLEPNAQLIVDGKEEQISEEFEYTVTLTRQELRTRTIQVVENVTQQQEYEYTVNVWRNGKLVQEVRKGTRTVQVPVTKNVEETYSVNVPSTETRKGTRLVVRPQFELKVDVGGKLISLDDFFDQHEDVVPK